MKSNKENFPINSAGFLQKNRGFTLIEAMVVLAIVSIVVGMAYSSFRTPEEKLACRYIFSTLQLKKMEAVSESADKIVTINAALMADLVDSTIDEDYEFLTVAPVNLVGGFAYDVTDGIDFGGGDNVITFTSKGMPTIGDAGSVYVRSMDDTNKICAVTVSLGGMVKMWTSNDSGANWN